MCVAVGLVSSTERNGIRKVVVEVMVCGKQQQPQRRIELEKTRKNGDEEIE